MGLFGREAAAGPTVEELEDRDLPPRVQGVVRGAVSPLHGRHQALVGLVGEIHRRLYCGCEGTVTGGPSGNPGDPAGRSRCFRAAGDPTRKAPRTNGPRGFERVVGDTYSPTRSPLQYHRRTELNFRVRNGIGCDPRAIITDQSDVRSRHEADEKQQNYVAHRDRVDAVSNGSSVLAK